MVPTLLNSPASTGMPPIGSERGTDPTGAGIAPGIAAPQETETDTAATSEDGFAGTRGREDGTLGATLAAALSTKAAEENTPPEDTESRSAEAAADRATAQAEKEAEAQARDQARQDAVAGYALAQRALSAAE